MAQNKKIGGGLANLKTIFHDGPSGTLDGQQNTGLDFIGNTFSDGFTANIDSLQTTFFINHSSLSISAEKTVF